MADGEGIIRRVYEHWNGGRALRRVGRVAHRAGGVQRRQWTAPRREPGRARGKGSGLELEQISFNVWTPRGGRAVGLGLYPTREQALDAIADRL